MLFHPATATTPTATPTNTKSDNTQVIAGMQLPETTRGGQTTQSDIKKVETPKEQLTVLEYGQDDVTALAQNLNTTMFGAEHWAALQELLGNESGWQIGRVNESSYACGIGQSLPCSKMYGTMPPTVWRNGKLFIANPDYKVEVTWTLNYIKERYGNPKNALYFWYNVAPTINGHNWY